MAVFTKIVTGIFGKKSDRDMKILTPIIDEINAVYSPLQSLSDDELKQRFVNIRESFKEESSIYRKTFKEQDL